MRVLEPGFNIYKYINANKLINYTSCCIIVRLFEYIKDKIITNNFINNKT